MAINFLERILMECLANINGKMNLNRISYKLERSTRNIVSGMAKGDALLPIILLEACVTGGRTYHAYQRGGFVEARERGTEETLGAIFWLGGVQAFNKMGDAIGKKILKVKNIDFDACEDACRKPFKNYLKENAKLTTKQLAAFKFTKVVASVLLSNAVIGFIVPKLNQAITRNYQKAVENKPNEQNNINNFTNKSADKKRNDTAFKGIGGYNSLLTLANNLENDSRYKLLSSDIGIAGGRAINARNKHERREALFRDLSSIYFYMFCKNHIDSVLNYITTGRATRLDAASAAKLTAQMHKGLGDKSYSAEEFETKVLGKQTTIPAEIEFENDIIKLDKFKEIVGKDSKLVKTAERMSRLQPQIEGTSILTKAQVQDIYNGGLINDPRFLNKVFRNYSNKKSTNPTSYYPEKDLRNLKQRMHEYVGDILKKAKSRGQNIDFNTLKKANKANFAKNAFNLTTGLAVSAYFLSTAIPKVQYWITQRKTGEYNFPGVQKYEK